MARGKSQKNDEMVDIITVYSFAGTVLIPTEKGSYWATAIGGVIESRPTGAPILYSLRYIWDTAGVVFLLPEPVMIRVNTALAVAQVDNFQFPAPDPEPAKEIEAVLESDVSDVLEDEDDEVDEDDEGDEVEQEDLWETELQES